MSDHKRKILNIFFFSLILSFIIFPLGKEIRGQEEITPEEKEKEILKGLKGKIILFQNKLNKVLRVRPVPRIEFVVEKEVKKAAKVEELLEKIKQAGKK